MKRLYKWLDKQSAWRRFLLEACGDLGLLGIALLLAILLAIIWHPVSL